MSGKKRDWDDPRYKSARKECRSRDGYRCRRCGSTKKTHCHHIRTWAAAPTLRFVASNMILLCKKCHEFMHGKEAAYASLCLRLLSLPLPPKR